MDEHDMIRWTAFQLNILVCREIGRVVNVKKENVELQWAANRTMERVDIGPVPLQINCRLKGPPQPCPSTRQKHR
jgi:hypothetical protein